MSRKSAIQIIRACKEFIFAPSTKLSYRTQEKYFTRDRQLPFESLVLCMLRLLRHGLHTELHRFGNEMQDATGEKVKRFSVSAFIQNRKKLKPDIFLDINHILINEFYSENDEKIKLYKGMRLVAIDGSTINLPVNFELKQHYGVFNNQSKTNDVVLGRVSVLYDVLNELVIDGSLKPYIEGEVTMAQSHIRYMHKGYLALLDRGYPSFDFSWRLQQIGVDFVFRCKHDFSTITKEFYNSENNEALVQIKAKQNQSFKDLSYEAKSEITVRMIRVELSTGEVEILMTSLCDVKKYPHSIFKELYGLRWKIETFYDRFKNILSVENFSGQSHQFIQQEFNAALYVSNLQTILLNDSKEELENKFPNRQYQYKANRSFSLTMIREKILAILLGKMDDDEQMEAFQKLLMLNAVPIREGRSNKRNMDKYRQRTKPKQFANRRLIL